MLAALNKAFVEVEENLHGGVGLVHLTKGNLEKIEIPLPPLDVQKQIVAEIEGSKSEIKRLENSIAQEKTKIQATIARVWSEAETHEAKV